MPISEEIREMILNRCSASEIKIQAVNEGMLTLRADGVLKLKNGATSIEEVLRETTNK
jgi:type IV pilus assembly protein PilB